MLEYKIAFSKLFGWSLNRERRTPGVGVISIDIWGTDSGEGSVPFKTDVEAQKHRYQTGLETPVVCALTYEY